MAATLVGAESVEDGVVQSGSDGVTGRVGIHPVAGVRGQVGAASILYGPQVGLAPY